MTRYTPLPVPDTVRSLRPLPPEDIYGNTKKLRFILDGLDRHAEHIGRPPAVLDFGCGNADAMGQYLADGQRRYYGVDMHEASLEHARQICRNPNTSFSTALPREVTFDALVYADVLEHLHDPTSALRDHVRQLAPDGVVLGSVPNGYGPCEIEKYLTRHLHLYEIARWPLQMARRLAGRARPDTGVVPYNHESGHVVFFTLKMLDAMAKAAGLTITRFGHGGFIGADLTGATIFRSPRFAAWNARVSDRLPPRLVSTWYFEMRRIGY
jgi:SAM-dependent methyltransferase